MKTIMKRFAQRGAIVQLQRLTDRQLADIGIERADIKKVVKQGAK